MARITTAGPLAGSSKGVAFIVCYEPFINSGDLTGNFCTRVSLREEELTCGSPQFKTPARSSFFATVVDFATAKALNFNKVQ